MSPQKQLDKAVKAGDLTVIEDLIARHPSLLDDRAGLWMAAAEGRFEIVEFFLDRGADPDARHAQRDMGFGTPLLEAAKAGHRETADLLIARGATLDIFARTALGRLDEVREMLAADPGLVHADYGTGHPTIKLDPMSFAHCCGDDSMYRLLIEHGATANGKHVWTAIDSHNLPAIRFLLGIVPWREDASAQATYIWAASRQETLDLVLGLGMDLNAQCANNGEHAGHFYVRKAMFEPFVMVLDAGIDLDAQRHDGGTMLHTAARMGLIKFAEQLLDRGARHDIRDHAGTSRTKRPEPSVALEYALIRKSPEMAEYLQAKIALLRNG